MVEQILKKTRNMKKTLLTALAALLLNHWAQAVEPTAAETTIRHNILTGKYEVFAKFDVTGEISIGGSMITVILPESAADQPLIITPVNGGGWVDGSVSFNHNGADYHGIFTAGSAKIPCTEGAELKLFEFYVEMANNIRLWKFGTDILQTSDGTEYISNFYIPQTGFYIVPEIYGDGLTDLSPTHGQATEIKVFPNPAVDNIWVTLQGAPLLDAGEVMVKIIEVSTGRELFLQNVTDRSKFKLDVSSLYSGSFTIQLLSKGKVLAVGEFIKISK
jgi:hypothetical protein